MKVSDIGEFALINRIRDILDRGPLAGVDLGIGDDAALLTPTPGRQLVISSDLLVEGIHFSPGMIPPRDLGYKALAVNLSDLAAMGAQPALATVSLALPAEAEVATVEQLYSGMLDLSYTGVVIAGGDLSRTPAGMTIAVTAIGQVEEGSALRRDRAVPGDLILVSGCLGDAAAGLALMKGILQGAGTDHARELMAAHNHPVPEIGLGRLLVQTGACRCAIDISDGLVGDLDHICRQSGTAARVEADRIPLSPALVRTAAANGRDPLELALFGGEDYRLLFTLAPDRADEVLDALLTAGFSATPIGDIIAGSGVSLIRDGTPVTWPGKGGYDHFS